MTLEGPKEGTVHTPSSIWFKYKLREEKYRKKTFYFLKLCVESKSLR